MEPSAFLTWTLQSEIPIPNDIGPLLVEGEQPVAAFKAFRDAAVFTTKRLIVRDAQGMTGKKVEIYSLPYNAINMWSSENAGKLDSATLTARERTERLIEHAVGQAQVVRDRGGLSLRRIAAERLEAIGQIAEALHRLLCNARIIAGHVLRGLGELLRDRAEPSRVENAVSSELLWVARARILW